MEQLQTSDEAGLLRQTRAGSWEAFALLIRHHEAAVRWFLARAVRDPATADDLAQEVFLCCYRRLAEYRGDGSLRAWLIGIARNLAAQHLRTAARRQAHEQGTIVTQLAQWRMEHLAQHPWDGEDQQRTFEILHECLQALPPECRHVVEEHYFQGRTIAAIAQRQGRNGGAVRMMLLRIRKALQQCIRQKLAPEV